MEEEYVRRMTNCSFIGTKETVKEEISQFIKRFNLSEIMITSPVYGLEDKLYSIEAFSEVMNRLNT